MIIFGYLFKEIYKVLIAIILILLLIFISNLFINYMNNIVTGAMSITFLMKIMSLQVPLLLAYLLPLAFYLSILIVLGRMHLNHEIVIFSSSGMSNQSLYMKIGLLALLLTFVVAILMFWIEPKVQWYRLNLKAQAAASTSLDKVIPGQFISLEHGNATFYARDKQRKQHRLHNVFFAEKNNPPTKGAQPTWDVVIAKQALGKTLPQYHGNFIVFQNGHRYTGTPGKKDYKIAHYQAYGVKLKSTPLDIASQIKFMPTTKLWQRYNSDPNARAEFQWRLAMPISVLLLSLLGYLLSNAHPRQGKFAQLFPAILCYVVYANTLFIAKTWIAENHTLAWLGMWWCHGLLLLLCLCIMANRSPTLKQKLKQFITR